MMRTIFARCAVVASTACLLLVTGCASTNKLGQQTKDRTAAADATTDGTSSAEGKGKDTGSGSGIAGGSPDEGRTSGTSPSGPAAPGVRTGDVASSKDPVKVGLMYSSDSNAVVEQFGADAAQADARKIGNAVLKYVNDHGGVAGRPMQPVWYDVSATDSPQVISQGACTRWTEDEKVILALPENPLMDTDLMRACLGKAGVLALYLNTYSRTPLSEFAKYPLWFEADSMALETFARVYVAGLAKQGFFKSARIGVLHDEGGNFSTVVKNVLLPELKRAGANVVATATNRVRAAEDLPAGGNQASNAVLRFRGANVTHVMFFEPWVGWVLFAQAANAQGWQPKYGLSSQSLLQAAIETGLVPTQQLTGARAVGWNPGVDVPPPASGSWARKQLCLDIFKKAGLEAEIDASQDARVKSIGLCGGLLLLADAARGSTGTITSSSIGARLQTMTEAPLANLVRGRFGPARHFGATQWRPIAYDAGCGCFKNAGGWVGF